MPVPDVVLDGPVTHALRGSRVGGPFDLILCRNLVFTYFDKALQAKVLSRLEARLRPGGYLLASVANNNEAPYIEDGFFGVPMYWSNFSQDEYRQMLAELDFEVLDTATLGHGFGEAYDGRAERHPVLLARAL